MYGRSVVPVCMQCVYVCTRVCYVMYVCYAMFESHAMYARYVPCVCMLCFVRMVDNV